MKIAVMTDTNSGITVEEGKRDGIFVLPMPVIIDGESYLEGISVTHEQVYQALQEDREVLSSQPSPADMLMMWDDIFKEGYDEIVYIPMTSGLSGSYNTAARFAEEYDGKIHVVDNHRISMTLLDSVYDAKYMAEHGKEAGQIQTALEEAARQSDIYITIQTLKHIVKSGRITAAGAAFATMINIKPVLKIEGGKLDAFAKGRGMKTSESKMLAAIQNNLEGKYADVPREKISIGIAGTFERKEEEEAWIEKVKAAFPGYHTQYKPLPCSIACHVGANAEGVAIGIIEREV